MSTRPTSTAPGSAGRNPARLAGAPLRILGIDPGTVRLGYGVVDVLPRSRIVYVECGVLAAPGRRPRPDRLHEIGVGLRELLDELRPDAVAMEEAFYGKSVQATLALGEARGMAHFVVAERGLPVVGYSPAVVKRTVAGYGRAGKSQIGFMVRGLLSLRRVPAPDAADALAIAICHARARVRGQGGRS